MSNVKRGDLAMVVGTTSRWNGVTCTTLEARPCPKGYEHYGLIWWDCEFPRPMPCHNTATKTETWETRARMADSLLRKIAGPDVNTTEHFEAFDFGKEKLPGALRIVTESIR